MSIEHRYKADKIINKYQKAQIYPPQCCNVNYVNTNTIIFGVV